MVFLFEYATCGGLDRLENEVVLEGLSMYKTFYEGFKEINEGITSFIDTRLPFFKEQERTTSLWKNFMSGLDNEDFCVAIAPEKDRILYNISREIEKSGKNNMGSSSKAIKTLSDKYQTYKKLQRLNINMPHTFLKTGTDSFDFPLLAKPIDGVSGEGIFMVRRREDIDSIPDGYILQKYIEGKNASATFLVGDEINLLSINTQEIEDFKYKGAKLPFEEIPDNLEPFYKMIEKIKGLYGFVGVDFIQNEETCIIEINPRPTTPLIAFKETYGVNVSELVFKNFYNEKIPEIKPIKRVHFYKKPEKAPGAYLSFKNYSIVMEDFS